MKKLTILQLIMIASGLLVGLAIFLTYLTTSGEGSFTLTEAIIFMMLLFVPFYLMLRFGGRLGEDFAIKRGKPLQAWAGQRYGSFHFHYRNPLLMTIEESNQQDADVLSPTNSYATIPLHGEAIVASYKYGGDDLDQVVYYIHKEFPIPEDAHRLGGAVCLYPKSWDHKHHGKNMAHFEATHQTFGKKFYVFYRPKAHDFVRDFFTYDMQHKLVAYGLPELVILIWPKGAKLLINSGLSKTEDYEKSFRKIEPVLLSLLDFLHAR
ncbi:MAG: hypothetical protein EP343_02755 [Deltaproteobacteria bacterium]|nr:MAG: hypothetical protein EP343_02755 [Deltaproteobacteria bacterium]